MSLFLATFFFLYGCMHAYAFFKAKAALGFTAATGVLLAVFMLVMVAAPLIVRYAERHGIETVARVFAYAGYLWLGLLFLFTSYAIVFDLYRLLAYAAGLLLRRDFSQFQAATALSFFMPLVLALATSVYGFFEARNIRAEHITVKTTKLPADVESLTIAQISDVHLGLIVRQDKLRKMADLVRDANPDILVSTGDLVDGQVCELDGLSDLLRDIRPRYGKFAVTGNHEFYAGIDNATCFTEKAGFGMLRGGAGSAGPITIAGVDDPTARFFGMDGDFSGKTTLQGLPADKFTLFLKHRPLVDKATLGLFDLQLSGHVHKGQIFPFTIVTWLYYPIQAGYAGLSHGSHIYVSRGAGTWGPPIRFMSPPEVAVITLVNEKGK